MIRSMRREDASAVWDITVQSLGYSCERDVVARQIEKLADNDELIVS